MPVSKPVTTKRTPSAFIQFAHRQTTTDAIINSSSTLRHIGKKFKLPAKVIKASLTGENAHSYNMRFKMSGAGYLWNKKPLVEKCNTLSRDTSVGDIDIEQIASDIGIESTTDKRRAKAERKVQRALKRETKRKVKSDKKEKKEETKYENEVNFDEVMTELDIVAPSTPVRSVDASKTTQWGGALDAFISDLKHGTEYAKEKVEDVYDVTKDALVGGSVDGDEFSDNSEMSDSSDDESSDDEGSPSLFTKGLSLITGTVSDVYDGVKGVVGDVVDGTSDVVEDVYDDTSDVAKRAYGSTKNLFVDEFSEDGSSSDGESLDDVLTDNSYVPTHRVNQLGGKLMTLQQLKNSLNKYKKKQNTTGWW